MKKGIRILLSTGQDVTFANADNTGSKISDFKNQIDKAVSSGDDFLQIADGMVCISQIVYAQEVDVDSEKGDEDD